MGFCCNGFVLLVGGLMPVLTQRPVRKVGAPHTQAPLIGLSFASDDIFGRAVGIR